MRYIIPMLALILGCTTSATSVMINITGFDSNAGQAVIAIFSSEDWSLPPDPSKVVNASKFSIDGLAVNAEMDLPAGSYVALAFHDENENRRFDHGEEMMGMSGDPVATGHTGSPPSLAEISFEVSDTPVAVRIVVREMEQQHGGPPGGGAF